MCQKVLALAAGIRVWGPNSSTSKKVQLRARPTLT